MPDNPPTHHEGADPSVGSGSADEYDPFDHLVLDADFVRGGSYEPPARTRVAIARYGGRQTSWRHGGGLHDQSRRPNAPKGQPATSSPRRSRFTSRAGSFSSSASSRLPLVISIVVVAIAAFLMFR